MAFIRRVRTGSGAVAVQVVRYVAGRQEIVKHVGSAHSDAQLGVLLEQAREWLEPQQQALDLDVSPEVPVENVPRERQGVLLAGDEDRPAVDGPGRTEGTASVLLRRALEGVYDQLGFDAVGAPVFRDLVIARIVEPTSKRDSGRVLEDLGANAPAYATIKRHLRAVLEHDYRATVADRCFEHAAATGGLGLVLYDVTTLYFEAEKEDGLRKVGYSKERRVDPQIVVGLLVDRTGFPLEISCFEGNKAECDTRSHALSGSR